MDTNNSSTSTIKNDGKMLKSVDIDLISSKSTNKVIQNFMKCIATLILHVENALSTSDALDIVNNSTKITNDNNEDIVEIKEDPDATNKYLKGVKKCVLQLCLLFIENNIYINCDITFNKIDFYSCLDDSTRSLVINYLTENVGYLIEHIGFIISMFTEETSREDAKDIRKSLSKIYKQILLIPLNPNLDETPQVFQNLNSSLWYAESIQHLSDQLLELRTSLIKLKKAFKRRNLAVDNSDLLKQTPTKRKSNSDLNTPNLKKAKLLTPDHAFLKPNIPFSLEKTDKKTKKRSLNNYSAKSEISTDEITILSDSESVPSKKKHKRKKELKENEIVTIDSDTESVKKKKKSKINSENKQNGTIIVQSDNELDKRKNINKLNNKSRTIIVDDDIQSIKLKKKHKINNGSTTIVVDSDAESVKKKKKHKIKSENRPIIINDIESTQKKTKFKINTENKENGTITLESDTEPIKKKHKINNKDNGTIVIDINTEPVKKKKKLKLSNENKKNELIIICNDVESIKNKHKHKINKENKAIIVDSDIESVKNKKKLKTNPENHKNDPVIIFNDTDSVKRKKKIRLISQENNTENANKTKSELSENKIISENCKTEFKKAEKKLKVETENQKNKLMSKERDIESVNNKINLKTKSEISEKEIILETSNSESKKEKNCDTRKQENKQLNSPNKSRTKNDSESSIISIGQLFTTHLDISDKEILLNKSQEKNTSEEAQLDDVEDIKKEENVEHGISHEIFGALSTGELQIDYEDESVNVLDKIMREKNLNENEKFLYIQDLLIEAKEKNELPSEIKEKLKKLTIIIDWEVPLSHEIGTRLTAGPLPHEQVALKALAVTEKKYNLDEDKIIRQNWKEFCKRHDLDGNPVPFLKFRHGKTPSLKYEERKKFVQYMGKGLPQRALHSIYKRFKTLFRDKDKLGRFSPQEDQLILTYCEKINRSQNRFSELANILNRNRPAIERRYRVLTQRYNETVKWTIHIESELVNGLLKAISSKDIEDLRHTKLTKEHYKQVAKSMEIPWEKIRTHWLKCIYTKLYASEPLYSGEIRLKLINMLTISGITDWRKIDWNEIKKNFNGFTNEFLWGQMLLVRKQAVPKKYHNNLGAVLKYLKKYIRRMYERGSEPFSNKLIKRYKMFDGSLDTYE